MTERKNGADAGPPLTLGATAKKLCELGYQPISALTADRVMGEGKPGAHVSYVLSEHPPAIAVHGSLVVLVLAPGRFEDRALEQRARAVLEKRGLLSGPVRIGSDGQEARPIRFSGPREHLTASALDSAVIIDKEVRVETRFGMQRMHAVLPLDGQWPQGTLLSVPLGQLPEISAEDLRQTFQDVESLPYTMRREKEPPPKPSRRAWLGDRS